MDSAKGKGVVISIPTPPVSEGKDENATDTSSSSSLPPATRFSTRNASSKYDFVKVKVWLGDNADHYYVLSRFLLSRMLTVTKIPNHVAVKITLELKKLLIDNSLLDVSQSDLEANLFKLMERRGYGEEYINCYKMMTRFHHQRVPLVILVCGTACAGKSTIATQLAQRLNLPNVLQTDMVYELLRTSTEAPLASTPVWTRDFNSSEEFITEFCRECRIVRKGLAGDLKKAMKDGKPIIIEGIHLDPSIYLMDEENRDIAKLNNEKETKDLQKDNVTAQTDEASETSTMVEKFQSVILNNEERQSKSGSSRSCSEIETLEGSDQAPGSAGQDDLTLPGVGKRSNLDEGNDCKSSKSQINISKKEKTTDPIIVPIVLKMAEFDHKALLEEWISTKTYGDKYLGQMISHSTDKMDCNVMDQEKLISNLKTIQDYLCSFEAQGLTVVNISATTFPQTLDWLHSYLLHCIERGVSDFSSPRNHSKGI